MLENTARRLRLPIPTLPYVHSIERGNTNWLSSFGESVPLDKLPNKFPAICPIRSYYLYSQWTYICKKKKFYTFYLAPLKKRCSKEITRFWMHEYGIKCAYKLLSLQHSVKVVGKKIFFIIQHNVTFSSHNFSLCTYCIHQSKSQSCLMRSFTEKFCLIFNSCISKEEVNNKQKCYWTAAAVPSK